MSLVTLSPARLAGTIRIPPSKSVAHRMILGAALARGHSEIAPVAPSRDILATIEAVTALGVRVRWAGDRLFVDSTGLFVNRQNTIHCGESGSTLRFMIPVAALSGGTFMFTGEGRLPKRPLGIYLDCLPGAGVRCETEGGLPLSISGTLRPGRFCLPGDVSSQFVTGLLLALPLLEGDSEIILTSPLQSRGYVDITLSVLADFGVVVENAPDGYRVPGGQCYRPGMYAVEGDWSQAAFFLSAGALGGDLTLEGLNRDSKQGDRAGEELFRKFGAKILWEREGLHVSGGKLIGFPIDATDIPDLVPILAVTAACAQGQTVITGAGRLRIKESDRLAAMTENLRRLGAQIDERDDGLTLSGVPGLIGGQTSGHNDHRIVMSMAIAALRATGAVEVTDAHSIEKSYPSFFQDYNTLGGKSHVL